MSLRCLGAGPTVKEFTVWLIHVPHVSHPAALKGSARYVMEIVDGFFFSKYTSIDVSHIDLHTHKFRNLAVESRLEIAFVGRPKGYKVPNRTVYNYEHSEGL
jgi:hypothetical protein